MSHGQGDLFSGSGLPARREPPPDAEPCAGAWDARGDAELIAALADADLAGCRAVTAEIGRRRSIGAIPALEALCRRFAGFGLHQVVSEQAAALDALVAIGGPLAAQAVARLLARGAVQGPGLKQVVRAAVALGADLAPQTVLPLLRHDDPAIRADACRCIDSRSSPEAIRTALDLLEDLHEGVREAAAGALGRAGRKEARECLVGLLRRKPSADVIDAIAPVADEDCIILLARLGRENGDLRAAVLDALDAIDHPRARQAAATLRTGPG